MSFKYVTVLSAVLLSACVSKSDNFSAASIGNGSEFKQKIETCWRQAELAGDLYKFITPAEASGITSISGATAAQVQTFNSCVSV